MHEEWLKQGKLTKITPKVTAVAQKFPEIGGNVKTLEKDLKTITNIALHVSNNLERFNLTKKISSENKQVEREVNNIIAKAEREILEPYKHREELLAAIPWRRTAHEILSDAKVTDFYCTDLFHALIAILRSKGVPALLVKVFDKNTHTTSGAEFFLAGKWFHAKLAKKEDAFKKKIVRPKIAGGIYPSAESETTIRGLDTHDIGLSSFKWYTQTSKNQRKAIINRLARNADKKARRITSTK